MERPSDEGPRKWTGCRVCNGSNAPVTRLVTHWLHIGFSAPLNAVSCGVAARREVEGDAVGRLVCLFGLGGKKALEVGQKRWGGRGTGCSFPMLDVHNTIHSKLHV